MLQIFCLTHACKFLHDTQSHVTKFEPKIFVVSFVHLVVFIYKVFLFIIENISLWCFLLFHDFMLRIFQLLYWWLFSITELVLWCFSGIKNHHGNQKYSFGNKVFCNLVFLYLCCKFPSVLFLNLKIIHNHSYFKDKIYYSALWGFM